MIDPTSRDNFRKTPEQRAADTDVRHNKRVADEISEDSLEKAKERSQLAEQDRMAAAEITRQRDLQAAERRVHDNAKGAQMIGKGGVKTTGDDIVSQEFARSEIPPGFSEQNLNVCANGFAAKMTALGTTPRPVLKP